MATPAAPGRVINSLLIDRPFVQADGSLSPWAAQVLLRLLNFVGVPATSSGGTTVNETLSEQITNIANTLQQLVGAQGADAATQSRVAALEQMPAPLPAFSMPGPQYIAPLAPISGAAAVANEGAGLNVYDAASSTGGTINLRTIIGTGGINVAYSSDGKSLVLSLYISAPLTSNGATLTSNGSVLTSGGP